jgi:CelD/BcsL family acetyltransferase involved in cellulose biosynthesis
MAPLLRCRFIPLTVLHEKQQVGVAPLLVKKLGGFCTINWPPFPYLGPLVPSELIPATLSALALEGRRRRAVGHQQSFYYMESDWPIAGSISSAGDFTSFMDRTFVVPLRDRSNEDLLAAMSRNGRRQIRRGQNVGIEIYPAQLQDFELMDEWSSHTYAAQAIPSPYRTGTYGQIFNTLRNAPGTAFRAARLNGQTVAVDIAFSYAQRVFDWQVGVDPSHKASYPQAALIWHGLLWARDSGALEFDMVCAPREGIAEYKTKFGAVERPFTVLRRQARAHRIAYSAMSGIRARLAPIIHADRLLAWTGRQAV